MDTEQQTGRTQGKRSLREWIYLAWPEARMRVATRRMPRDWFELLTKIPVVERIVIKRFVENLMCDQWLKEAHRELEGMDPTTASKDVHGRTLLHPLLVRMAQNREKTPRQLRRIRKHLGM